MQIRVITKTRAKRPGVTHLTGLVYEVAVAALPVGGAANQAVIESLAKFFNLPKSQVHIITGHKSVNKVVELLSR